MYTLPIWAKARPSLLRSTHQSLKARENGLQGYGSVKGPPLTVKKFTVIMRLQRTFEYA